MISARRLGGSASRRATTKRAPRRAVWFVLPAVALLVTPALVGCGKPTGTAKPTTAPSAKPAVSVAEAQALVDGGLAALRRHDAAGWKKALPATGAGARATAALYGSLSAFSWPKLAAEVTATPGYGDRFFVRLLGQPDGFGPPDRLLASRVLVLRRVAGRLTVTGDLTPAAMTREYLMVFRHPIAVHVSGALVIAEGAWKPRARALASAVAYARARLREVLAVRPSRGIVILLFSSDADLRAYFAGRAIDARVHYLTYHPDTLAPSTWWPADVGVVATALAGNDAWMPFMLSHEMTHGFTMRWFADTAHAPALLEEGLAVAVEGGRSYAPLRTELAHGNKTVPLLDAFGYGDLWAGMGTARVHLAYLEGGSVVKYILRGWGPAKLRAWAVRVADTNLTGEAVRGATQQVLGVSWARFASGWRAFVATLP